MTTVSGKSCLNCSRFLTCADPKKIKVMGYSCVKFRRMKNHPIGVDLFPNGESSYEPTVGSEVSSMGELTSDPSGVLPDDFVAEAMRRAYDPDTGTLRDLRVDDSHLPMAKNFFDYCLNIVGKSVKMPFARQMWVSYILLAEYCPRCTKEKYYTDIELIPVDMETRDFKKKIAFLEYGVCPYCEATRYELIQSKELADKIELILIAGQRSGKSTLLCMLISYITHVYLKSPKLSSLYVGIQDFTPLSALLTATTSGQALKTLWSPIRRIFGASSWYCLSEETQISMAAGSPRAIRDVRVGDTVRTYENEDKPVTQVFDNGYQECFEVALADGKTLQGTSGHHVRVLVAGAALWKRIDELTLGDEVIVED